MATVVASKTRAISRPAAQFLTSKRAAGARRRAGLIYEMQSKLYPDLYSTKYQPADSESPRERFERLEGFREQKLKFVKSYTDPKHQAAKKHTQRLLVYKPKPSIQKSCPDPVSAVSDSQIALLDPSGARTRLFAKTNPECARVGDILLVRQRTGDPFAGVCIDIRRRGVDTAILLRGQLTRVGVEMWYKIYSPLVEGIEVVQRAQKRARRARLTYMRKVKHDRGSVENVVRGYLRQKAALGIADGRKKGVAAGGVAGGKKGGKKGKKK